MSPRVVRGIVDDMDIGHTLRCYTVEPLREPVPRTSPRPARAQEPEFDPVFHRTLLYEDPTFAGLMATSWFRHAGR
jgi:hypothetical protein